MPRPIRLDYKDTWYHVINRGRGRQTIFHSNPYYEAFLQGLHEAHDRFKLEIHSYCLMGNHYHLLVKTRKANLSRCMRHINGLYTQRYNRLKGTDGPLFRGRFKSIIVDQDQYLLRVSRYIHRNPIDMNRPLVKDLEDYVWSSYPVYLNLASAPEWLSTDGILDTLNSPRPYSQYKKYVEQGNEKEIQAFYQRTQLPPVLGSDEFKNKIRKKPWKNIEPEKLTKQLYGAPTVKQVVELVSEKFNVNCKDLTQSIQGQSQLARQVAIYISHRLMDLSLTELAKHYNVTHISAISQQVRRLKIKMESDDELKNTINMLCQNLTP